MEFRHQTIKSKRRKMEVHCSCQNYIQVSLDLAKPGGGGGGGVGRVKLDHG